MGKHKTFFRGKEYIVKRRILALLLTLSMLVSLSPAALAAQPERAGSAQSDGNTLRLWYDEPVGSEDWTNRALPIGNGTIGGLTYGEIVNERLHVNEKTLWGGKAISDPHALDGYTFDQAALEAQRQLMDDHSESIFAVGTDMPFGFGNPSDAEAGQYQDLGDVYFDFTGSGLTEDVENYVRELDMRTAVSGVSFDHGGVHYEREYLSSYPDKVMAAHFTASKAGALSFTASLSTDSGGLSAAAEASGSVMWTSGTLSDSGEQWAFLALVDAVGGTVTANADGTITVEGADEATVYIRTDTDYEPVYPDYRDGRDMDEIIADAREVLQAAQAKGYAQIRADHTADHGALFSRVEIDLGGECPEVPTDELMAAYREGDYQQAVEEMAFQMGRYLTIAASRQGDELPTNLCGIWLVGDAGTYWGADFHFNVNIQMNYWPTMVTNLAECAVPFNEFVESLVVPGRLTAAVSNGVKTEDYMNTPLGDGSGFLINTQVNAWGHTWPIGMQMAGWNIGGSSWALINLYDYYLFTGDREFLEDHLYPMLKEMARFWDSYLWYSDYQGRWVVGPSVSAEQGPTVNGTAYDQSIVWELYKMAIAASEELGVDEALREGWKEKQAGLNPILIGEEGQVKEWFEETRTGYAQAGDLEEAGIPSFGAGGDANQGSLHRHTSQLIGLYPGTLINKDTREWMDAAVRTLEIRNLGGTGWSKAMKLNMYARTGLGEIAYELVNGMCAGNSNGLLDNLLDSHPPFQIDGNYGLTAGIAEMLLQSQLGYTQFLPALPEAWADGSITGLAARGGFVVDMAWSGGFADRFSVTSQNGGEFTGEYENLAAYAVKDSQGREVETTALSGDRISFPTTAGETYTIEFNETPAKLRYQIALAQETANSMTEEGLLPAREVLTEAIEAAQAAADGGSGDQYYSGALEMAAARVRAESAISLLAKIGESEAFYQESLEQAGVWTAAQRAAQDLADAILPAQALLSDSKAVRTDFIASSDTLDSKMAAITALFESISLSAATTGGKLTLTASDEQFEIRYTLDGAAPDTGSQLYEGTFVLPKQDLTIRAALYIGERRMSEEFAFPWNGSDMVAGASSIQVSSLSAWSSAQYAIDGNPDTYWTSEFGPEPPVTLTLTFDEPITFDSAYVLGKIMYDYAYPASAVVEYWDEEAGAWTEAAAETDFDSNMEIRVSFDEVTASQVRLVVTDLQYYSYIAEFQLRSGGEEQAPAGGEYVVEAAAESDGGEAKAVLTAEQLEAAAAAAREEGCDALVIAPKADGGTSRIAVELPAASIGSIAGAALAVRTGLGTLTLPAAALEDLNARGGHALTVSMEEQEGAVRMEILIDGEAVETLSGGILAALPAENAGGGSVLTAVGADGAEAVIRKSAVIDGMAVGRTEGPCTLKVSDNSRHYADTAGRWAEDAAAFVSSRDLVQEADGGNFSPNGPLTRAVLAALLYRLEDAAYTGEAAFTDVEDGAWYADAAGWADSEGILEAGGGRFAPDEAVTREQLVSALCRYARYLGLDTPADGDLGQFTDSGDLSDSARDAAAWAVGAGLMAGKGAGLLDPAGIASRGEAAALVQRLVALLVG